MVRDKLHQSTQTQSKTPKFNRRRFRDSIVWNGWSKWRQKTGEILWG